MANPPAARSELRILQTSAGTPVPDPSKLDPASLTPGKRLMLKEVKTGHWVKITAIQLESSFRHRLYEQGLHENLRALVLHNDRRGRVLLDADGEMFLLGRQETSRIEVRELVV
ncbi:MAG: ferrous iron transport protein A [Kiritimatiellia bacterium]